MVEKLAFDLVDDDGSANGVTYYAEDGKNTSSEDTSEESFLSLFDDEGEEPELELKDEPKADIELSVEQEAPVDALLTFDEFEDSIEIEAPAEGEVKVDDAPALSSSTEDEDMAFDGLMQMSDTLLPGATVEFVAKEEEPARDTTWEEDGDHAKFIPYMINCLKTVPPHSGQTTVGCEKAITYLRAKDKEISRAVQTDTKNQIDEKKAETLRDMIHNWVERLESALDNLMGKKKKKKKAAVELGKVVYARINDGDDIQYFISVAAEGEETLLKVEVEEPTDQQVQAFVAAEDGKITKEAGQLMTFVDPFLQSITRLLMRAHITQGRDLRDVYSQLDAQYKFTPREQLSIHELLLQKGMPLNVDLGRLQEKGATPFDGKSVEYVTQYPTD